ncbi:c-type cytochrome [Emcibacter nanhaiensis]|uniref:C-type cytochrome n=1 Tax=Emcibacter nanhaiensis TaxID=1505037 RepID=A0A501PFV3_9PROT|nr:c-type cytochrome [Emcibacter nanhaiensis]TPD58917.1 c-type cytochrome [Emcibacter nanhaiensis]
MTHAKFLAAVAGLLFAISALPAAASAQVHETQTHETLPPPRELTPEQTERAAANYQKYCALCHGADREGYANDHAPSLKSKSLMESGIPHAVLRPMSYGREGTAMGAYLDEMGGPMTLDETWDLTYWLYWQAGYDRLKMSTEAVHGDIERGRQVYGENCTSCHGAQGEGVTAPALGNVSLLAHMTDEMIRHAIREGRQDTPMQAWKGVLSDEDIDNVTAFLRSRAGGWEQPQPVLKKIPGPEDYVINPDNEDPDFTLTDGIFVSSKDLLAALQAKKRMVLLDTRVASVWQRAHIEGAIPVPYYTDFDELTKDMPRDVQIVAYCSCPRAAAEYVVKNMRERGFIRTAVLYEGIFGWMNLGYPVMRGDIREEEE